MLSSRSCFVLLIRPGLLPVRSQIKLTDEHMKRFSLAMMRKKPFKLGLRKSESWLFWRGAFTSVIGFLLCLEMLIGVSAQEKKVDMVLISGKPIEREIVGGELHTYLVRLTAGQWMRVVVEQRGIDLAVALIAPDGRQMTEANVSKGGFGRESLSYEAAVNGDYRLVIRSPIIATALKGDYQVRLEVKATATTQDKKRSAAEQLLAEAARLSLQGGATAAQTIENAQAALPLWRELGDRYWEAHTLHLIGVAYLSSNKYDQAIEFFSQALAIRREVKDRAGEGITLNNLGQVYRLRGPFDKAIEYYEQALVISREIKDRAGEASILAGLGVAFGPLGSFEKAIEYYEQAMVISREIKDRRGEGASLNGMGNSYYSLSRFEKAIEYYEQGLAIRRETKDWASVVSSLSNLGNTYNSLGRHERAIEYLEQALVISREIKHRRFEAISLNNLGDAHRLLSHYEKAIECYEQSQAAFREIGDQVNVGHGLANLGDAYLSQGRYEKAIENYKQALAISRERKNRATEGYILNGLGDAYARARLDERAIECFDQALALSREVKDQANVATALRGLAEVERNRGNSDQARAYIAESLRISEALRSDLVRSESRASFLASVQNSYELYIDLLMRQHRNEPTQGFDTLAVEVSERQRARGLLDLLVEARADVRQGVDASLLERERLLSRQLNDKAQRLTQTNTPEQSAVLKQEISQLETEYEQAQAAIRKNSPHYAALAQPQPLKLNEIQQQLDTGTLLLEYSLGKERSYLWAITKDSLASYELPKEEQIQQSARQVYDLLTARDTKTPVERGTRPVVDETQLHIAAQTLSQTLLGPVAATLGDKRLVIVADGVLQYIPFAMLPEPISGKANRRQGEQAVGAYVPLIAGHEIVNLQSVSTVAVLRTELAARRPASKEVAVLADPVFSTNDPRVKTGTAVSSSLPPQMRGNAAEQETLNLTLRDFRGQLERLFYSRDEAEAIYAAAPAGSGFKALDFQATRTVATSAYLSQYRIVHFATHGLLNSDHPYLSGLVLSLVNEKGEQQDGFLRLHEIYNLHLNADLVVLSACQTALGKEIKGEGLIGLTRGFMYAGAPRVVASLWKVDDVATAELMKRFYRAMLQEKQRPAAALRAAQLEMMKKQRWQSPFYWAAFTLQGEWK